MAPWVRDAEDASATSLRTYYQTQLANTYIAYSGTGNLTNAGDYVRINGPNVWIEFSCQNGVVCRNQIHCHTIWRDRARNYGGSFHPMAASQTFSVYPNPTATGEALQVKLTTAIYTLRNSIGQTIATKSFKGDKVQVVTAGLAPGTYVLSLEANGQEPITHRFIVK